MAVNNYYIFIAIFLGGGIGAVLRHCSNLLVQQVSNHLWLSTLLVNAIGSLTLVMLLIISENFKISLNGSYVKEFLVIGLLGGLTTFSTFSLEVIRSLILGQYTEAFLILGLNMIFGIIIGLTILYKKSFVFL